jgi:trk system potassium uptake protein TrkA
MIERNNQVLIPDGDMELKAEDNVSIVASSVNASRFFRLIGINTHQVRNTMIIGGGKTTFYLARKLLEMGIQVKIIEKNMTHCEELCEMLPEAMIIHGDGTDQELLDEEGLAQTEGFAALTNMDEENILLSLYAKRISKAKMITKVNSNTYDSILSTLDIGSIVHPKHITAEYILQYVRAMQNSIGSNVETLYRLADEKAEALEFIIRENPGFTNVPLNDLNLKPNILVCAISRNGKTIIPKGQDCLLAGDSVVIITTNCGKLNDIRDILSSKPSHPGAPWQTEAGSKL